MRRRDFIAVIGGARRRHGRGQSQRRV